MRISRLAGTCAALAFCSATVARAQATAPAAAPAHNDYSSDAAWLCRPGRKDACAVDLTTTVVATNGSFANETWTADPSAPIDCFYVYPTVSGDLTANSALEAKPAERAAARGQFARFGSKCRTYAPLYRQVTLAGLMRMLSNDSTARGNGMWELAFSDVRDAWRYYLEHDNNGRGVVLIGHSQGSTMLGQLVRSEIDGKPVQARMVSVILAGFNYAVPKDRDVGGTFLHIPLCHSPSQTGCAITFSSFRSTSPPPPNPFFGHVTAPGMISACVNPAAIGGGSGELHPYFASTTRTLVGSADSKMWLVPTQKIETPWVTPVGLASAKCASNENSSGYLEITVHPSPSGEGHDEMGGDVRIGGRALTTWGIHTLDMPLTIGNLVDVVGEESRAYLAKTKP